MLTKTNRGRVAERGQDPAELVELQRTLYESRNPTRRWLHRERLERISAELRRAADQHPGGRALEVGPGAGPYVDQLCAIFAEVVATDIEDAYLDYVRAQFAGRTNLSLLADDIANSSLEPASFDLILCTEVIEHTPDPPAVLAGIARLLGPGGTLVLSTPQPYSTLELLGRIAFRPGVIGLTRRIYREPILPTGHISLLSRRRMAGLLEATGLRITRSYLSGLYVPVLAEIGGEAALAIERRLAGRLAAGPLSGLLWTQYWILVRPS